MYAAASKPGGAGGVKQDVAKEFVGADKPGKLPERKATKHYDHASSRKRRGET